MMLNILVSFLHKQLQPLCCYTNFLSFCYGYTFMLLFTLVSEHEVRRTLLRSTTNIFGLLQLALAL